MAKKTLIRLTDDLDGRDIDDGEGETLTFAVRGTSYEIDLGPKNIAAFDKAVAKYVNAARKSTASTRRQRSNPTRASSGSFDPKIVRAWAETNGVEVNARGRIKGDVVEMWRTATN